MNDLTVTDDWLAMRSLEEQSRIKATVNRFKLFIGGWQPRPCPPHPRHCPAGGEHVWLADSTEKGAYIACEECGADAEGQFYPEEEVNGHVSR